MGKKKSAQTDDGSADALVKKSAKAEKRLLRLEQKAEQALVEARAKLRKAERKVEQRLRDVSEAELELRARQADRASGPSGSNGTSAEEIPPTVAAATEVIAEATATAPVEDGLILKVEDESSSDAAGEAGSEPAAELILPPAATAPAKRRGKRSAAPKEQAS